MIKKIKQYKFYLIAFFIPCLILLFTFIFRCYIRNTTVFMSDSYAQYFSFFSYFKDVLSGKQSLFYSLNSGLGSEMLGTYAYYLASPINLILIFFKKEYIDIFFMITIILKISLSSLFMYIYVSKKQTPNMWKLIFSLCYAFMAYNINYYFNVMWLDGVMFAPLLICGIEKLVEKNQGKLYTIILLLSIFSNYYIGISLSIFSCIYFIYYLFLNYKKQDKKYIISRIKKFLITSILAGLSCMILIIPSFIQIMETKRQVDLNNIISTTFLEFLSKGYIASHNFENILNFSGVNWYCGIIIIVLVCCYFMNHKISKKEKIASLSVIAIFLLSFFIPILNIIWHGLSYPNGFNYRYSFLFSLFLIILSSRQIEKQESLSKIKFLIFLLVYIILSFVLVLKKYSYNIYYLIDVSLLLLILYAFIIESLIYLKRKSEIKLIKILLLILVCGEFIFNIFLTFRDYEFTYIDNKNDIKYKNEAIEKNRDNYHRMEFTMNNTLNDSLLLNYNGFNSFNSMLKQDIPKFIDKLGFTVQNNAIYYHNGNLISDSILGISKKYGIEQPLEGYQKIGEYQCSTLNGIFYELGKTKCNVLENKHVLQLGYMINKNYLKHIKKYQNDNVFEYNNLLLNSMVNKNLSYFKRYKPNHVTSNIYEYNLDDQDYIYLYMAVDFKAQKEKLPCVNIYINGKLYEKLTINNRGIKIIKNEFKDQKIKIHFEVIGEANISSIPLLYSLDNDLVYKQLEELKQNELQITKLKTTKIEADIEATKQKNILFLSIPYSKGWDIYVDSKKQPKIKLYDTFLGVELKPGKHHITLRYHQPGLKISVVISSISLILLTFLIKKEVKDQKK